MNNGKRTVRIFFAIVVALAMLSAYVIWFFVSRPAWQLTVRNFKSGVQVIATTEDSPNPVYTIELLGASIEESFENLKREEISSPEVRTVSYDATLKPGAWTVIVAGVKIEIMEARIVIDQHLKGIPDLEGSPGESLTVDATSGSDESLEP